eukprot:2900353-Rhodomonas_salina.4
MPAVLHSRSGSRAAAGRHGGQQRRLSAAAEPRPRNVTLAPPGQDPPPEACRLLVRAQQKLCSPPRLSSDG